MGQDTSGARAPQDGHAVAIAPHVPVGRNERAPPRHEPVAERNARVAPRLGIADGPLVRTGERAWLPRPDDYTYSGPAVRNG